MAKPKLGKCPACRGRGEIFNPYKGDVSKGGTYSRCYACNGSGSIEIEDNQPPMSFEPDKDSHYRGDRLGKDFDDDI